MIAMCVLEPRGWWCPVPSEGEGLSCEVLGLDPPGPSGEHEDCADGKREPSEGGGGRPGLFPNRQYLGHFSLSPRLFHNETFMGWLVCFHLDGIVGARGDRDNWGRGDLRWRQDGHPPMGPT